jgi:hypothetical protein
VPALLIRKPGRQKRCPAAPAQEDVPF